MNKRYEVLDLIKYKGADAGNRDKIHKVLAHVYNDSIKKKGDKSPFADWLPVSEVDTLMAEESIEDKVVAKAKPLPTPDAIIEKELSKLEGSEPVELDEVVDYVSLDWHKLKAYAKDQGIDVTPKMKKVDVLEDLDLLKELKDNN